MLDSLYMLTIYFDLHGLYFIFSYYAQNILYNYNIFYLITIYRVLYNYHVFYDLIISFDLITFNIYHILLGYIILIAITILCIEIS